MYKWKNNKDGEKRCIVRYNPDGSETFIEEGSRAFLILTDKAFLPEGESLPEIGEAEVTEITPDIIRAEASRRINEAFPQWKQSNLISRGVELVSISLERSLSEEEDMERNAIQKVWDWIKDVREASNSLELSNPQDYASDEHWPKPLA